MVERTSVKERLDQVREYQVSDRAKARRAFEQVFMLDGAGVAFGPWTRVGFRQEFAGLLIRSGDAQAARKQLKRAQEEGPELADAERQVMLQFTHDTLGNIGQAFDAALALQRLESAGDELASEFAQPVALAEWAVLAGRPEALDLVAALELLEPAEHPGEADAIIRAYKAIALVAEGHKADALESLDEGLEAATTVTEPAWIFQTLRTPFRGATPWMKCASKFHERVRKATVGKAEATYLLKPMQALKSCVGALKLTQSK